MSRHASFYVATLSLTTLTTMSCRSNLTPINVAVAFENTWKVGNYPISSAEKVLIKTRTLETLRCAYDGFDINFAEASSARRIIRVEDTPFVSNRSLARELFAAGVTYPASTLSSVRFDVLFNLELAAARCQDISHCLKTRTELLEGLGRGIGATAAHELGHQAGLFGFAVDSRCDNCYDGAKSTSYEHFFGTKHWSPQALEIMQRVLPSGPPRHEACQ